MFRPSALAICLLSVGLPPALLVGGCSIFDMDSPASNEPPVDDPNPNPQNPGDDAGRSTDERLGDPPVAPGDPDEDPVDSGTDSGRSSRDAGSTRDAGGSRDAGSPRDSGRPPVDAGNGGPVDSGPGPNPGTEMCNRWRADRQDLSEGTWSGNLNSCNAGDVSTTGRDNALKLVNLYRHMAGLPAVTHDATKNARSQQCALMMDANKALSHSPPTSWKCYSEEGADGAGQSNIATTPGVKAVDLYMSDPGNETTLGHRRWILSKSLGPIGLGTTSGYSCMNVFSGTGNAARSYVAWPPPGPFPSGALKASFSYQLDKTGWSIQSDTIDLSNAAVTIKDGTTDKPVAVNVLGANYGTKYAIRIVPQGWASEKGHTYSVNVTGTSPTISYQVQITDCD